MKIKSISFANGIKIGGTAVDFAQSEAPHGAAYEIEIKDIFYVKLTEKNPRGGKPASAYTTLFNVKWWQAEDEPVQQGLSSGPRIDHQLTSADGRLDLAPGDVEAMRKEADRPPVGAPTPLDIEEVEAMREANARRSAAALQQRRADRHAAVKATRPAE